MPTETHAPMHMCLQGILGNDTVRIVDYTTLYDEVVRTTLWEEVGGRAS
jgi:hypothetical protein